MKKNILVVLLIAICANISAQPTEKIFIRFVNAKFTDTTGARALMASFLVSVKDSADFPPGVVLPPKCTVFEMGREKVILLQAVNLGVVMNDQTVREKNPEIYAMIKDSIDLGKLRTSMLITYKLRELNFNFRKMSLTPVFKEKRDGRIRVEKRFEFEVN
jgi:hypothetical protein